MPEACKAFDNNLASVGLLVLAPVMERHEASGQDEEELCASDGPKTTPVGWELFLHEDSRAKDTANSTECNLKT